MTERQYDTQELSPEAVKALKETIDQFAAMEVVLTECITECAKIPGLIDKAAREIQYDFGDNRASKYSDCTKVMGGVLQNLCNASAGVTAIHEMSIRTLSENTGGQIQLRRPRTKALMAFASRLSFLWPGRKFGR